jgi:hypothetical protein
MTLNARTEVMVAACELLGGYNFDDAFGSLPQ